MRGTSLSAGLILVASVFVAASSLGDASRTPLAAATNEAKPPKRLSDDEIRKILIGESIAAYEGSCPCPYSTARNGSRCGKRSAYSRPGGAAPLCYAKDVTREMVDEYRKAHPGQ